MSRTQERATPRLPGTPHADRPSPWATFGLTSLGGLLVLGASAAVQVVGAGPVVAAALGVALAGSVGMAARGRLARPGTPLPWWVHWDVVGFAATATVFGLATILAVETLLPAPGLYRTTRVALPVALAGGTFVAAVGALLARREGASLRLAVRRAAGVWTAPPGDWAFFVLGTLVALPLAAVISPVAWDSDSGRLLVDAAYARREGLGFVVQSQQVFLPMLIFPPVVAVAGVTGAMVIPVVSMQALVGVVGYITRKLTGGVLAPIVAMLALLALPPLVRQADVLPMYPLMLTLGTLGGWVAFRAMRLKGRRALLLAVLAGFLLAATAEAHDIGKLFFVVPLFLLAVEPTRRGVKAVAFVYLALVVFYIPRALVNLAEGGLQGFASNRTDWMVTSGYTRMINREFWHHPVTSKSTFFLGLFRPYWDVAAGWLVIAPAGLAAVALTTSRWKARVFALLCAGLMLAGLLKTNAPPHPRYLSPVLPGLAIAAGVGAAALWTRRGTRAVAGTLALAVLAGAGASYHANVRAAYLRQEDVFFQGLHRITDRIDDNRAITGVRTIRLMSADPSLRLLVNKFFTEEEWVTYLTWPSDREVLEVLRAHDVGWLLVQNDRWLEVQYHNTWIQEVYGKNVWHHVRIELSPNFCRVARAAGYSLYRVGPCGTSPSQ